MCCKVSYELSLFFHTQMMLKQFVSCIVAVFVLTTDFSSNGTV
jgi:hypothetical protein